MAGPQCQVPSCGDGVECADGDHPACMRRLIANQHALNEAAKPKRDLRFVYEPKVQMGQRYRDKATRFEGVAMSVTFYEYGCERVSLRAIVDHRIYDHVFDAPALELVEENGAGFKAPGRFTGASDV